jgi:hypothetical protein
MHADSTDLVAAKPAAHRLGTRARRAAWPLDARTRESRKLRRLVAELGARFGISADDPLLLRAAELNLCAEQARKQLIRGTDNVGIENIVKIENLSARACRDLAAKAHAKPNGEPSLAQYLAAKEAEPAAHEAAQ